MLSRVEVTQGVEGLHAPFAPHFPVSMAWCGIA